MPQPPYSTDLAPAVPKSAETYETRFVMIEEITGGKGSSLHLKVQTRSASKNGKKHKYIIFKGDNFKVGGFIESHMISNTLYIRLFKYKWKLWVYLVIVIEQKNRLACILVDHDACAICGFLFLTISWVFAIKRWIALSINHILLSPIIFSAIYLYSNEFMEEITHFLILHLYLM